VSIKKLLFQVYFKHLSWKIVFFSELCCWVVWPRCLQHFDYSNRLFTLGKHVYIKELCCMRHRWNFLWEH